MGFEPLRVAGSGHEVCVRDDGGEHGEVGLDAGDGRVLHCAAGFAHHCLPCAGGDDEFRDHRVEVCAHDSWCAVDEGGVYADTIAGWKVKGLDLANAQRVVLLRVFGRDA